MHDSQLNAPSDPGGGETRQWQRIGSLFDAVCDLPAEQWEDTLVRLGHDVEDIRATLDLLRARTQQLHSLERSMAQARALEPIAPEAMVGQHLGPWKLLQPIGVGGMGVVFLASRADALYERRVAIKLLQRRHDVPSAERLVEERQILAGLEIPGIARLYDAGISGDGRAYLVMEYVEGTTLDAYAATLDLPAKLRLMQAICAIVHDAHTQLIVHCDLKPGNILVDADGRPVLLDFGIARLLGEGRLGAAQPAIFASPAYGSPELLEGRNVGAPADVFSLGVMLAELLTGHPASRRPQDTRTPVACPSTHATLAPALRRRLRGDLDAIVEKACALQPADRYQGADALARDLARYLEHRPVSARPQARVRATGLALRRHWRSALVAVAVVTGAGLLVQRLADARTDAES
ncbi:MAG: serine/threonine-protein kinase, partial [Luteimonas sp.]